jgi:hypothetical protein
MNKSRYYLIGMLLLVAVLISPVATSRAAPIITSDPSVDYFQRHPEQKVLSVEKSVDFSGSDWYQRHQTELGSSHSLDTTDYYVRHFGLSASALLH